MAEQSLEEAAARLGAVYSALIHEKIVPPPMGDWALPGWMTPRRLRPFSFTLTTKVIVAITQVYFPDVTFGYARGKVADTVTYRRQEAYQKDLRTFLPACTSALRSVTNDVLSRQEWELLMLSKRFAKPGIEDQLHESAKRIWSPLREILPGGVNDPYPTEQTDDKQATKDSSKDASEILPGGVNEPSTPQTSGGKETPPSDFIDRHRLMVAIKAERESLEFQNSESSKEREKKAQSEAIEISNLLAVIAVHPDAEEILRLYVASPMKGTEKILFEINIAISATKDLHKRLTSSETEDDAWGYAPLVVSAVTRLRLHEVPGLPEFAVAMGRLLAKTKTDAILSAATMLMIGLSIAFSGPIGAVVVGTLDLALSGIDLGITLFRMHEQEIAATATDFSDEERKLASHTSDADAALSVAGAFLSAIALTGSAKQLLKTRPRTPEVLERKLVLDYSDHSDKLFPTRGKRKQAIHDFYNPNEMKKGEMIKQSGRVGDNPRTYVGENREFTKEKMRAQSRRGIDSESGSGPVPDYEFPTAESDLAASSSIHPQQDYRDFNSFEPADLDNPPDVEHQLSPFSSNRKYTEAEMKVAHDAAHSPPNLETLYKRQRVSPREQITGIFFRDSEYPRFEELKEKLISQGASDPIIPNYKFTLKNPPTVDHIIPENLVRKFEGFTELNEAAQREVMHMEENLELVCEEVNKSRKDMPYSLWEGTAEFKIPPDIRQRKIIQEKDLVIKIQKKIDDLLKEQRQVRGTSRPISGSINPGLRLTGDVSRGLRLLDAKEKDEDN